MGDILIYSLLPGYAFCRAFGNLSYWLRRLCSKRKHGQPPFRSISRFLFCCRCSLKRRADSWKSRVFRPLRFVLHTPIFWLAHQKCARQAIFYQFRHPADIGKYLFYFLHKSLHIIRVNAGKYTADYMNVRYGRSRRAAPIQDRTFLFLHR